MCVKDSSNNIGYVGNTSYNLKYIARTRNFRHTWPHNNLLSTAKEENSLLKNVLSQNVGLKRNDIFDDKKLQDLRQILKCFLKRHRRTKYKSIFRKCMTKKKSVKCSSKSNLRPVSKQIVKEFVHRIIFNIIPLNLFGSEKNRVQFERNLRHILYFGKSQVYTLKMVVNKMTTKNIKYLKAFPENINKTNLMAKVFIWVIRVYISAALKCVFYITESNYSNKFVFYEKCIWQKIQQKCLDSMKKKEIQNYKNAPANSHTIADSRNIYVVKILPKFRGSRPVCVRWNNGDNSKFIAAHKVQIMKQTLSKIASIYFKMSQTSSEEFHNGWLKLYHVWLCLGKPQVYFVRVDFVDAFGSIDQDKLMQIIDKLKNRSEISEIEYCYNNRQRNIKIEKAFEILKNYVTNFVFKNNKYLYKLIRGIHQGGPLSSALCNLYFAEINATYCVEYMNDPLGFFAQNCDDYLYITLDRKNATTYLNRMEEGFPKFNMVINSTKTETNIRDNSKHVTNFGRYQMDIKSFQLFSCYKSYQGISTFHKSVFRSLSSPGKILLQRLLLFSSMKLDKVYLDCTYNTIHTIIYNVFLVAYLAAIRCVSLIKALFTNYNTNYIYTCVLKCTFHIAKTVTKRIEEHADILNRVAFQWIALKAFYLKMKNSGRNFCELAYKIQCYSVTVSATFNASQRLEIYEKFKDAQQPDVLKNVS